MALEKVGQSCRSISRVSHVKQMIGSGHYRVFGVRPPGVKKVAAFDVHRQTFGPGYEEHRLFDLSRFLGTELPPGPVGRSDSNRAAASLSACSGPPGTVRLTSARQSEPNTQEKKSSTAATRSPARYFSMIGPIVSRTCGALGTVSHPGSNSARLANLRPFAPSPQESAASLTLGQWRPSRELFTP